MLRVLRHRQSGFARALAAFALLAMVVRALVPAGYMVGATASHSLTVTLCSGHGAQEFLLDPVTGGLTEKDDAPAKKQGADAPCVFAVASTLDAPQTPPALPVTFRAGPVAVRHTAHVSPGRGLAAPPPWSTGPPLTA